jgi:phage terminase large subunit-like protein
MDNRNPPQKLQNLLQLMLKDRKVRRRLTRESHELFFHCYFSYYVKYRTAPFQKEMFRMTEDEGMQTIVITAFRGSAKSTIMNMSYILWSILGTPGKKFIEVVGQTQAQARQHLKNIKEELEHNPLLSGDLGPFKDVDGDGPWNANALLLENHNAKIMAVSIDQSVRGLRHKEHRPDLIVCDDIEDLQSVKTREGRDKTYAWVKSELIPAGDTGTRIVFIGNLLHEDCLLKRLQREIASGAMQGIYREYPILNSEGKCLWPGKYPMPTAIEAERRRVGSDAAFQREYMLRIIPDLERLIQASWITYYGSLPTGDNDFQFRKVATGIDPAISKEDSADNTAMVSGRMYGYGENMHVYILPNPVNEHLTFLETIQRAKSLSLVLGGGEKTALHVEDVAFQRCIIEELEAAGFNVIGVPTKGQDKRARLALASHMIQSGREHFPMTGCERLIEQLVGFGSERYDDLADAFATLMLPLLEIKGSTNHSDIWKLNEGLTKSALAEEREHDKFFYPDHSDDRDSGSFGDILHMQF